MNLMIKPLILGLSLPTVLGAALARADIVSIDTPGGCVCAGPQVAPNLSPGVQAVSGYCNFTSQTGTDSDNVLIEIVECGPLGLPFGNPVSTANPNVSCPYMQNRVRYTGQVTFPNPGVTNRTPNVKNYKITCTPRAGTNLNNAKNESNDVGFVKITGY